jgi:cell wall-associated NlpC family hydrolase
MTGVPSKRRLRPWCLAVVTASLLLPVAVAQGAAESGRTTPAQSRQAAALDRGELRLAADAVEAQALRSGALRHPLAARSPAVVLLLADDALIRAAVRTDPGRRPVDTRPVMGSVPFNLRHHERHRPSHFAITGTRALRQFAHSVAADGSSGIGDRQFRGATVAPYRNPDGVYVDPRLPAPAHPTVGMVAIRTALAALGQPYVWGGAGPATYDCSGLVLQAYAKGGIHLTHFSGDQWNEGRLIPAKDALPGDLIMFGNPIFHVAIYLGAGWMLNAPFTGHYVDVQPVWRHVAGVVRP